MTKLEDGGAAHTPTPYRLWKPELEIYPSPHPDDRRLVGANNICVGILFGAIDEVLDAQDFIVAACNSHAALVKVAEMVLAARDNGDETALVEAAQAALLTHRRAPAKQE